MEQLQIIEKLFDGFTYTLDVDHPKYMYSGAIYDVWNVGTELERNLACRLQVEWANHLENMLNDAYRNTRYHYITGKSRPEFQDFKDSWKQSMRTKYCLHIGIQRALDLIM